MTSDSRRRLVWLIGSRVVVSTLLLGSAVVFQVNAPGTLAVDPFFFLIGLTYGLSVIYAITLRFIDRSPWLVTLQFAGDVAHRHRLHSLHRRHDQLLPAALRAADRRRGRGADAPGRASRRAAERAAVQRARAASVRRRIGYIGGGWIADVRPFLPPIRVASYTVAANAIAFVAVALLSGSLAERLQRADDRLAVASTALADLQAFNEHVIESLTSGLITTDRAGRVVSLNRAAEQITALPAAARHRTPGGRDPAGPAEFAELLDAELGGAESQRADYSYRTADGSRREIGLSAAHLVTPDGPAGYLLTFQDVTEIRRLEHEARRRQRLAAVGEMAAGIAHEIRNPLASMRGSIQVLRAELSLTDEQASLMDIVLRESDRLNETIRSFLAYARPQAAVPKAVDLMRVLTDAATLLRNSPELKPGHRVVVDGPADGLVVDADEHQIRQVVWNLATNGLRAMPDGGTLRLVARPSSDDRRPRGPCGGRPGRRDPRRAAGHAVSAVSRLLRPGSGLGLAIVHRIVQDHRGEVVVESEVGRGTEVTVRLPSGRGCAVRARSSRLSGTKDPTAHPIATFDDRTFAIGPCRRHPAPRPHATRAGRILVADDERSLRELLAIVLRREGYDVMLAENGKMALAALSRGAVDLLISDIKMPDMSGVEVLRSAKQIDPALPAIMMTAFASTETAVEAMRLGACDYLVKPFDVDELKLKVREKLESRHLRQENLLLKRALNEPHAFAGIIGRSSPMLAVFDLVESVAATTSTVLITGESGTGKELVARALHQRSLRRERPVCRAQLRRAHRDAARVRAVRPHEGQLHRGRRDQEGADRRRRGRHDLPRRDRRDHADDAGEAAARAAGAQVPAGRRARGESRPTSASSRRPTRTCRSWWPRADSARTSSTASTSFRFNCRRCASGARTSRSSPTTSWRSTGRRWASPSRRSRVRPWRGCPSYHWPGNIRELENVIERAVALEKTPTILADSLPGPLRGLGPAAPAAAGRRRRRRCPRSASTSSSTCRAWSAGTWRRRSSGPAACRCGRPSCWA